MLKTGATKRRFFSRQTLYDYVYYALLLFNLKASFASVASSFLVTLEQAPL